MSVKTVQHIKVSTRGHCGQSTKNGCKTFTQPWVNSGCFINIVKNELFSQNERPLFSLLAEGEKNQFSGSRS